MKNKVSYFVNCLLGIVILALVLVLNGCIIPYPHFKETCGPLCGYVATEDSNIPIENALVEAYYPDSGHRKTYTDSSGYFSFPQKNRFHWGILFGVALNHSLPTDDYIDAYAELNIKAEGYDERFVYANWRGFPKKLDDPNYIYLNHMEMVECPRITIAKDN